MSYPIVYVDTSAVRAGKLEALRAAMAHLSRFVEANMPRVVQYGFFLDESTRRMSVVAVHRDSASLEHHLEVGGPEFRKFADLIELLSIDVYGQVGGAVVERLQRKAKMLGNATVTVHARQAGFVR